MKTIIVPVNFTGPSNNAARFAVKMAEAVKGEVLLVHAVELVPEYVDVPQTEYTYNLMFDVAGDEINKLRESLEEISAGQVNVRTFVTAGMPVGALKEQVDKKSPFAVVMGARQEGDVGRWFLGSNIWAAIQSLNCPVIVLPSDAEFRPVRTIGLACDTIGLGDNFPAEEIKKWLTAFKAELAILTVQGKHFGVEEQGHALTDSSYLRYAFRDHKPSFHFIEGENVEKKLVEFACKSNIDLLAVFPRHHDLLDRLLKKSHTKTLAMHPSVPLLVIHV